jgi:hypothetical protein
MHAIMCTRLPQGPQHVILANIAMYILCCICHIFCGNALVILEISSIHFVVQTLERFFDLNPSGRYVRFLGLRRLEHVRINGRRGWWIRADATSAMELSGWGVRRMMRR